MTTKPLSIAIAGASGRLGNEICTAAKLDENTRIAFGLLRHGAKANPGFDAPFCHELSPDNPDFDVLIDVSTCAAVIQHLQQIQRLGKPMIIGVTGFDKNQINQIQTIAKTLPVLLSGNFSFGVNLLLRQVRQVAGTLGAAASFEIEEIHHTAKKDFPSGTALMLADAIIDALGQELPITSTLWPQKPPPVAAGNININCIRKANVIGQHTITFTKGQEQVILGHTAHHRDIFAHGALQAAHWIFGKKPGLYTMNDALG